MKIRLTILFTLGMFFAPSAMAGQDADVGKGDIYCEANSVKDASDAINGKTAIPGQVSGVLR